jgi:hypothetical protein
VLEAVRMLSNFETARHKLIQVVLSGQPQLEEKLALPRMLRLRQRISILRRLRPLSLPETTAYISHRLRIAGHDPANPLFTRSALDLIAWWSGGIPRNINNICFNALSLGCALECKMIDSSLIEEIVCNLCLADHDDSVRASSTRTRTGGIPQPPDPLRNAENRRSGCFLRSQPSALSRSSPHGRLLQTAIGGYPQTSQYQVGSSIPTSATFLPTKSSPLCRIPGSDR